MTISAGACKTSHGLLEKYPNFAKRIAINRASSLIFISGYLRVLLDTPLITR